MAIALDTTGAVFGLWQGGRTTGIGLANETGALTWNEHVSWDFDAGKAFYRAVFGYDYQDVSGKDSGTRCSWSTRVRSAASASTCRGRRPGPGRLSAYSPSMTPTPRWLVPSSSAAASSSPSGTARTAGIGVVADDQEPSSR